MTTLDTRFSGPDAVATSWDETRRVLEAAELFHEVLEHRWYMSERAGHDVPTEEAIRDYVSTVLPSKPNEATVVGVDTVEMPVVALFDDDTGDSPRPAPRR